MGGGSYDDFIRNVAADYPNLISGQEQVDTIAVPAVLAAYNWPPATDRARKLSLFVDAFFTKFPTFQNPPFHPKWKEVSLSAPLPGWQRAPAAQQWLKSHAVETSAQAFGAPRTARAMVRPAPRPRPQQLAPANDQGFPPVR